MSSDGGGGLLKDAERGIRNIGRDWRDDPFRELVNAVVDLGTSNLVGYDTRTGEFGVGHALHATDEFVGEISGRNKGRAEMRRTAENLRLAEAAAAKDRENRLQEDFLLDRQASFTAQGTRRTAAARAGRGGGGTFGSSYLGDEQDFLGL